MAVAPAKLGTVKPAPRTIVAAFGNDAPITRAQLDAFFAAAGERRVVLVTTTVARDWAETSNALLHDALSRPNADVTLVDWRRISEGKPWFAADGYHLNEDGIHPYASAIAGAA